LDARACTSSRSRVCDCAAYGLPIIALTSHGRAPRAKTSSADTASADVDGIFSGCDPVRDPQVPLGDPAHTHCARLFVFQEMAAGSQCRHGALRAGCSECRRDHAHLVKARAAVADHDSSDTHAASDRPSDGHGLLPLRTNGLSGFIGNEAEIAGMTTPCRDPPRPFCSTEQEEFELQEFDFCRRAG